jgi:Zn-dependent M28 family amino/carboxypeptidase
MVSRVTRLFNRSSLALAASLGLAGALSVTTMSLRSGLTSLHAAQAAGDAARQPAAQAGTFDSARAWEHLRRQVGFGPRPAGSGAINECRRYILDQLKAAGITAAQQTFVAKTPAGEISMTNVVATIPGRRPERIILASHFDTKRATAFRFVGANDGASSTAALLELGRVLKAAAQRELTIELLFLDGEEAVNWDWGVTGVDNTYGSRYYVDAARKAGTLAGIKAMVLLDMIGETNAVFLREGHSTPWLVDIIWGTAKQLGYASSFPNAVTEVDDDHVAFLRAGVPSADVIDLDYPQWHTADDNLEHVNARSLKIVGDVILASMPAIEKRSLSTAR